MKNILARINGRVILFGALFLVVVGFSGCGSTDNNGDLKQSGSSSSTQQKEQKEKIWHDVISFSGTSNKNTQPFSIQGKQWRIKWDFQDSREFGDETNGLFIVQIYRVGESTITDIVSHEGLSANDTGYIYEGEGDFYFKISATNVKSWTMTVEDLY